MAINPVPWEPRQATADWYRRHGVNCYKEEEWNLHSISKAEERKEERGELSRSQCL